MLPRSLQGVTAAKLELKIPVCRNWQIGTSRILSRLPWHTLVMAVIFVILHFLFLGLNGVLVYDRASISALELWRMFSGHVVHFNPDHLFWNILAFLIIGSIIETRSRVHLYGSMLFSFFGVSLWLFTGESSIAQYCGLSGALNGIFVYALYREWHEERNPVLVAVFFGAIVKIGFELITHDTIFSQVGKTSVPASHAAGLITGIFYVLLSRLWFKKPA